MKNVFRGLSAKLALALLAVGTMTSCYEKEELDKTPAPTPEPAKYYIQGNVLDVENGKALNAKVTVAGNAVTVVNGYYKTEVAADTEIQVVADLDGYFTSTKTVYLPKTDAGSVSIATVDFALVGVASQVVAPDDPDAVNTPATAEESKEVLKAASSSIKAIFAEAGITLADGDFEIVDDGIIVSTTQDVEAEVGGDVEIQLPIMTGFASTIVPEDDNLFTKALTDGQIWVACA